MEDVIPTVNRSVQATGTDTGSGPPAPLELQVALPHTLLCEDGSTLALTGASGVFPADPDFMAIVYPPSKWAGGWALGRAFSVPAREGLPALRHNDTNISHPLNLRGPNM